MKRKILLPLLILAVGVVGARAIVAARPEPEQRPRPETAPLVRSLVVRPGPHTLVVRAQGTVAARTEASLTAEVAGRVVRVSDDFADGGYFEAGDVLLQVDDADYAAAVAQAEAAAATARLRLAQEEEEARLALAEWRRMEGDTEPPTRLVTREPQLANARAAVEAAEASLRKARRDLDRTRVRAPYAGRLRRTHVDVGSWVAPGTPVAMIYSVDAAEVRLPLRDEELQHLDLPLRYRDDADAPRGSRVGISARFAGRRHHWDGQLVRLEGEIDPRTRMVTVVAQVTDPYGRGDGDRPPLAVGMFVDAEIRGHRLPEAVVLPRHALRNDTQVLVIDDDLRLRFRDVVVTQRTDDTVVVTDGLAGGERICLSPLDTVVDGMSVRLDDVEVGS